MITSQKEDHLDILFEVLKHDQIKFDRDVIKDNNFVLGCRSTYIVKPNDFDFLHDLSHLIQFSDEEIHTHYIDFAGQLTFNTPDEWMFNQWICEPVTDQISMREFETFYIQYVLENKILEKNISFRVWCELNRIDELLNYLPDRYIFGHKLTLDELDVKAQPFKDKWDYENIISRWLNIKIK